MASIIERVMGTDKRKKLINAILIIIAFLFIAGTFLVTLSIIADDIITNIELANSVKLTSNRFGMTLIILGLLILSVYALQNLIKAKVIDERITKIDEGIIKLVSDNPLYAIFTLIVRVGLSLFVFYNFIIGFVLIIIADSIDWIFLGDKRKYKDSISRHKIDKISDFLTTIPILIYGLQAYPDIFIFTIIFFVWKLVGTVYFYIGNNLNVMIFFPNAVSYLILLREIVNVYFPDYAFVFIDYYYYPFVIAGVIGIGIVKEVIWNYLIVAFKFGRRTYKPEFKGKVTKSVLIILLVVSVPFIFLFIYSYYDPPSKTWLIVKVTDKNNNPISYANVTVRQWWSTNVYSIITDNNGLVDFRVRTYTLYTINVTHRDYISRQIVIFVSWCPRFVTIKLKEKADQNVSLTLNSTSENKTIYVNQTLVIEGSTNISTYVELYINNDLVDNGTNNLTYIKTFNETGLYTINFTAYGNSTVKTVSNVLYVNVISYEHQDVNLRVYLNGTQDNITIGVNETVNITALINVPRNITLYINGAEIDTGNGSLTILHRFNETGTYNITVVHIGNLTYNDSKVTLFVFVVEEQQQTANETQYLWFIPLIVIGGISAGSIGIIGYHYYKVRKERELAKKRKIKSKRTWKISK